MSDRQALIDVFLEKNAQINLSAIRDPEWVYVKHILDALELTKIVDLANYKSLCDVWTGGWFPLLALAQYSQDNKLWLQLYGLDARRKKVQAVQDIANKLWLDNVQIIWSRIEEHKKKYDIITARAVAYADKIITRAVPLIKDWGLLILYKELKTEERLDIYRQCKKFGLQLVQEHFYTLFEGDIERVIYVIENWSWNFGKRAL